MNPALQTTTDEPLSLASVSAVLRRRRGRLLWSIAVLFTLGVLSCLIGTRRYRATAEIQVQKEDPGAFGLESTVMGPGTASAPPDSLDYTMTLQTEAAMLRSPALADTVIEDAHLERTADYFAPSTSGFDWLSWTHRLPWSTSLEPVTTPLSSAPNRRYVAEKIFAHHLKVQPVTGTRLIDVSYLDPDPSRAAAVANLITRVLADMTFQQRFTATMQGSSWLSGQLDELRRRTEQAQARAAALERGTGIFGTSASRNVVLERLDSLNQTLTAAESNRILKESIDQVASSANPELISSLSGNSSTGSVASVNTSLTLIQGLRQQEAQVRSELAESSMRYGPAYPRVAELNAQLAGIATSIAAESTRLGQRAHTDWEIAVRQEAAARAAFEQQKQLASTQNDSVIAYELARQEADSSRDLYEGLLAKLKQASLLQGLRSNNVSVVSVAEVPPWIHPASPNIPLRIGAASAAGILLGLVLVAVAEMMDSSIHSLAQVETQLGVPLLAVLPAIERVPLKLLARANAQRQLNSPGNTGLESVSKPRDPAPLPVLERKLSVFSEALRSLRAGLQLSRSQEPPKVILVTSCLPSEGKTTLAMNLAALFAQGGSRVLLVDADMRRPMLHFYGAHSSSEGLAMTLSGPRSVPPQTPIATMPNLEMLAGSEVPPFPSELLGSPTMRELVSEWRNAYDIILFDSPPVLPVSDAVLLSRLSDVVLLVARHEQTPRQALQRGVEALLRQPEPRPPVGVVLNDVARSSSDFYQYFGHDGGFYAEQSA